MTDEDKNIVPGAFSLCGLSDDKLQTVSDDIHSYEIGRFSNWADPHCVDKGYQGLLDLYAACLVTGGDEVDRYSGIKEAIGAKDVKITLEREAYFIDIVFMVRKHNGKVYSSGFRLDLPALTHAETVRDMVWILSLAIHNFILYRLKDTLREVQTSGYLDGRPSLPETDTALQDAFRQEGKDDKELKRSQNPKRSKRHKLVSLAEAAGIAAARAEKAKKAKKSKQ